MGQKGRFLGEMGRNGQFLGKVGKVDKVIGYNPSPNTTYELEGVECCCRCAS